MKTLGIGQKIRFMSIDNVSGQEVECITEVVGDHENLKRIDPEEYGEATEGSYLVRDCKVRTRHYVVHVSEVLEILGGRRNER